MGEILLLIGSMALYFVTVVRLLPQWLLKTRYAKLEPKDRGLRRCLYQGKRYIVYDVNYDDRVYMRRYLLGQEEDHKVLRCYMAPGVQSMDCDVMLFDRYHKVIDVLHVREELHSAYTAPVDLPNDTAYVRFSFSRVNGKRISNGRIARIPPLSIGLFALITCLLSMLEVYVVQVATSHIFAGVFREDISMDYLHAGRAMMVVGLAALGFFVAYGLLTRIRNRK